MGPGRPAKYSEERKEWIIRTPKSFLMELDRQAHEAGVTRTEYVYALMASADRSEAKRISMLLAGLQKSNTELLEKIREYVKKVEKAGLDAVSNYIPLEPDKEAQKAYGKFDKTISEIRGRGAFSAKAISIWTKAVFDEMEKNLNVSGRTIRNKSLAMAMCRALVCGGGR